MSTLLTADRDDSSHNINRPACDHKFIYLCATCVRIWLTIMQLNLLRTTVHVPEVEHQFVD